MDLKGGREVMGGNTPAEQVIRQLPFRGEALEALDCDLKDGVVVCQVGIFGAPSKQNVVLGRPGFDKAICTRTSTEDLACEITPAGSTERIRQTIPRDLLR
jgi:hypothetical protein